jgi:hypothetical protein
LTTFAAAGEVAAGEGVPLGVAEGDTDGELLVVTGALVVAVAVVGLLLAALAVWLAAGAVAVAVTVRVA